MREILAIALMLALVVAGLTKLTGKTVGHSCPDCGAFLNECATPGVYFCVECDVISE